MKEKDFKRLIVEKKWLARLEEMLKDELDSIIMDLTTQIEKLAERYAQPLPEIEGEVKKYEKKVKKNLKIMGFEI